MFALQFSLKHFLRFLLTLKLQARLSCFADLCRRVLPNTKHMVMLLAPARVRVPAGIWALPFVKCFSLVASLPSLNPTFGSWFIPTPLQVVKLKAVCKLLVGLVEDLPRMAMKICSSLGFLGYLWQQFSSLKGRNIAALGVCNHSCLIGGSSEPMCLSLTQPFSQWQSQSSLFLRSLFRMFYSPLPRVFCSIS